MTDERAPEQRPTRLVGGWWAPAVGLSSLGLYGSLQVGSNDELVRESFFNDVASPGSVYVFMAALVGLLAYGIVRHASLWAIGQPHHQNVLAEVPHRLANALRLGLAQDKVRRDRYAAIMHWCIFSSILVLTIVTAQVAIQDDTPLDFLKGDYLNFFTFYGDLFGLIGLVGVGMAVFRRYIQRTDRVRWDQRLEDHVIILGLGAVLITGFLVETFRILAEPFVFEDEPGIAALAADAAPFAFVSNAIAQVIDGFNLSAETIEARHASAWWTHVVISFGWLGLIVFTKLDHLFFAPVNAFFLRTDSPGRLARIPNLEEREVFGVGWVQDFTWKQLFELDACVRCGRCTSVCPANLAGQPLSPMAIIQDLKAHLATVGPQVQKVGHANGDQRAVSPVAMVGEVIKDESLWACRTCYACVQECPVMIEHVPTIVDMRRYLVMDEARIPATAQAALENLEMRGHPWRGTSLERTTWMDGLGEIPMFDGTQDYLYWVGCSGALVERNLPITQAVFRLVRESGASFGVLGQEETCNGDPARRLGNEYLFQILAEQLVDTFKQKNVQRVITNCPHCFNTFKNEYPQFDGHFEVLHHTEFLNRAVQDGRLTPTHPVNAALTYHDSCYLGRVNGIYDAPRELLRMVPGASIREMKRSMSKGLCCGAGGGNMWQEEVGERRVNHVRSEDAIATGAQELVANCPFCIQMFEDGVPAVHPEEEGRIRPFDIAEVLERSVFGPRGGGAAPVAAAAESE